MKNKYLMFFTSIIIMILGAILVLRYLEYAKEIEITNTNKESKRMILVAYNSILHTNKIAAQSYFDGLMENEKAMEILKQFKYENNKDERAMLRGELFRLLNSKYKYLKKLGIRQYHFHTHKGESLLRFHRPPKNGDSLMEVRESIRYVNTELKPFFGFEGGKIFPGFRYVFPIIYNNDHLGSIEFSVPFEVIESKLQLVLPKIGYQLHLDKSISYDKVFDTNKELFTPSPLLEDFYIEHTKISEVENRLGSNKIVQNLQKQINPMLGDFLIEDNKNFSINKINKNSAYRLNFIEIRAKDGTLSAYLVSYEKFKQLLEIENKYLTFTILIFIALLIILILLFIVYKQFDKIVLKNNNIQHLLDSQDNIVILSDGREIRFANLKFFNFLGFKDLYNFKKKHRCICEFFNNNDRYFHLGKIHESENWIDIIKTLPHSQRMVSMTSEDLSTHIFSITINTYDKELTIINFTDISQTMFNYIDLEDKNTHDSLTNAFNREYFEQNYKQLLSDFHTEETSLALAMLDIDHFKMVNDTYGHDVGDEVLIHFVKIIEKFSREDDILIRWGGEEFILILKVNSLENLQKALEHIRKVIEIETFPVISNKTCSIGASIYKDSENIENTIKRADDAVYKAKKNGRNQVIIEL